MQFPQPSLKSVLRSSTVAVIAELKRRSPSKGDLNPALDPAGHACALERGGAAAISVLTEPSFFGGSLEDLSEVTKATSLPVLKKDFHVDPAQVLDAFLGMASAVLLIVRALPPDHLFAMMKFVREAKLEAVVEVRTESELQRALAYGAEMIGVNSRNLETLEIDERVPKRLMPLIPPDVIGIWESGVRDVDDVWRAAECGADAVLVGSALSKSPDPESLVRSLARVPRQARG
jgi:indole-3-glycerol phosphate synthase